MTDLRHDLDAMRRPRLLLTAARHGIKDYRRDRDLARLLRAHRLPAPGTAVSALIEEEARLEDIRQGGDGRYNMRRHVAVLIALLAEIQSLFQPPAPGQA